MQVLLYSTLGCHLCDQAKVAIWPALSKYQLRLSEIDISASDAMIDRYGTRIPVLAVAGHNTELQWPFTPEQVDDFLGELKRQQQ